LIEAECACQIPKFMQVIKQTFAIVYNAQHGKRDHLESVEKPLTNTA
jgi:hypothetical protein